MEDLFSVKRRSDITLNADGTIVLNKRVNDLLSLHEGDVVNIAKDGIEYYLYSIGNKEGRYSNRLRRRKITKKEPRNLRFHNKKLCEYVRGIMKTDYPLHINAGELINKDGRDNITLIIHDSRVQL